MDYFQSFKEALKKRLQCSLNETIKIVSARPLTPKEAIGNPHRRDFPLLKGKEAMIEADFKGSKGQAFTDMPGVFEGSISEFLDISLNNNCSRGIFIAGLNAVMRHFSIISSTVHCRNEEPKICSEKLLGFIIKNYGSPKIAFIGYQPAMLEVLSKRFSLRAADLDRDNIGKERFGMQIEGPEKTPDILKWADIILATGSLFVNKTFSGLQSEKPMIFYGVTAAYPAFFCGYKRFCPCSR